MIQFLEPFLNYKDIHPIRFWGFVVFIVLLIATFIFILTKLKPVKKKRNKKHKQKKSWLPVVVIIFIFVIFGAGTAFLYFSYRSSPNTMVPFTGPENTYLTHTKQSFGIDISHYQGIINWEKLAESDHDINYIFIRATMGADGKDYQFKKNWENAKENNYLRGAYHYYRPNENSELQFRNFSKRVKLSPGDFPPVLDIEEMGKYGTENLVAGVLNWLRLAEEHYGVIPIVYTGSNFYRLYLKGRIESYPLWIAAYSGSHRINGIDWHFHQFSDKIRIKGIPAYVDGNSFKGEMEELLELLIKT